MLRPAGQGRLGRLGLGPLTRLEIIHVNASDPGAALGTSSTTPPGQGPGQGRRQRRAAGLSNSERYSLDEEASAQRAHSMEMMVVTDKRMTEYHGNDIINYVLTLMSIVSMRDRRPGFAMKRRRRARPQDSDKRP